MTVIDDELLDALLKTAGSSFSVPESGVEDIVDRASGHPGVAEANGVSGPQAGEHSDLRGGVVGSRRLGASVRSHRFLVGAACIVVALAIAAGISSIGNSPPPQPAASAPSPAAGGAVPLTTLPVSAPASSSGSSPGLAHTPAAGAPGAKGGAGNAAATTEPSAPTGNTNSATGQASSSLPSGEVGQSAKIEQTGSLTLVVPKGATSKTMTALGALAGAYNGFVLSSQTQGADGTASATTNGTAKATLVGSITLQIPVASFATVLDKAKALGKIAAVSTKATDVTGQYVDLQAQITALQAGLQQYLTIMTKATTVGDILSVQAQINTIQTQIQQLQGQLQVLTTETSYSTLAVLVNEKAPKVPVVPVVTRSGASKAWHDSVHGLADALEGLIRISLPTLFVLLCGAVLVLVGRVAWRRYRRATL